MQSLLLDTALKYAKMGMRVIPVAYGAKNPIIKDWANQASDAPDTLSQWFSGAPTNIGITTGKRSGIIVIDIDNKDGADGRLSVADFEAKSGSYLPPTVTARTQSGGVHLFFQYPPDMEHVKGAIGILPHVDIRADGDHVVSYPSVGEKGPYLWEIAPWDGKIAVLPKVWKHFICGDIDENTLPKIRVPKKPFTLPNRISSGMRHATLLSYAGTLAVKDHMTAEELARCVKEANKNICSPPITDQTELDGIIAWATERIGKMRLVPDSTLPEWAFINEKGVKIVDDGLFVQWFKEQNDLVCINGIFYNHDGYVPATSIRSDIQNIIKFYVCTSLSTKVNNLFESLRNECFFELPPLRRDIVNLDDASLLIGTDNISVVEEGFTLNKLGVQYNPRATTAVWDTFLSGLFEKEDIITLQEYIGYCLVPTTIAQKALIMIGKGGEGKSVVGEVIQALFKTSMVQGELHKLQENRFMMAQLENKLVFYDDDLQSSALTDTGTFKKLVTATIPILVERKGEPHYEMLPYARILASGNKGLESCYDHTDGFYRRLILLRCKEKPKGRKDDKLLAEKIITAEIEGVLNWALMGLQRLMKNNWEFTISEKTQTSIEEAQEDGNSVIPFLKDESVVQFGKDESVTSVEFYDVYEKWCEDNAMKPLSLRTVANFMRENANDMGVSYSNKVDNKRGYVGVGVVNKVQRAGRFRIIQGAQEA